MTAALNPRRPLPPVANMGAESQEDVEQLLSGYLGDARRSKTNHPCLWRLFGKRRCPDSYYLPPVGKNLVPCHPPRTDHASVWIKDGNAIAFVSEPYGLHVTDVRKMREFAKRWGLAFEINAGLSPHNPGGTVAVIWRRVEVQ